MRKSHICNIVFQVNVLGLGVKYKTYKLQSMSLETHNVEALFPQSELQRQMGLEMYFGSQSEKL